MVALGSVVFTLGEDRWLKGLERFGLPKPFKLVDVHQFRILNFWPAPGSEDTELGVLMEPEVGHGEAEVYTRVQA